MAFSLIVRKKAEIHLIDAFDWYENKRSALGSEFLLAAEAALNAIQQNPSLFSTRFDNVRCALIPRFPYGIFYFIDEDKIVVIAVFHLSRNPKLWKS